MFCFAFQNNLADEINEAKRRVEDVEDVREKCSHITGLTENLAVVGRYIVKEGRLAPIDLKKEDYHIIFFNDILLITRRQSKTKLKLKETVLLDSVQIIQIPDTKTSKNQFRLCTSSREITFEAESAMARNSWVATLKQEFSTRA